MSCHPLLRRALALGALASLGLGGLGACSAATTTAATTTTLSARAVGAQLPNALAQLRRIEVLGNRAASDSQVGAFDDAHDRTVTIDDLLTPVQAVIRSASPGTPAAIARAVALIRDGAQHHDVVTIQQGAAALSASVPPFPPAPPPPPPMGVPPPPPGGGP